jgi:hypothetical protein
MSLPVIGAAAGFLAAGPLGLLIGGAAGAATAGFKEMSPKRKSEVASDVGEKVRMDDIRRIAGTTVFRASKASVCTFSPKLRPNHRKATILTTNTPPSLIAAKG